MAEEKLFDSHAHLLDPKLSADIEDTVSGIDGILCIYSPEENINLFRRFLERDFIWGAAGLHPHDAKDADSLWGGLESALGIDKVIALGETGLDFYYNKSPVADQVQVFKRQLRIAAERSLPVIVHTRNAFHDTLKILDENTNEKVLIHCFSGNLEDMRESVKRGYYIALGGIVTFPNACGLKEIAREIPLERLILETDSPYLAPRQVRGRTNKPAYLRHTAHEIAGIKGLDPVPFTERVYSNTLKFFGIGS